MEETVSDLSGNVLRTSEFAYGASDDDVLAEFRTQSGTTVASYYLKDRLGSTAAVTDSAGNVLEEYRYSAFGSPYRKLPDGTWEALGTETEALSGTVRPEPLTDRLYAGREWDSETGLHHYRARAYSPELGRFLQRDPAWQSDQVNPYAYVRNDPENFTDPTGGVANFVAGAAANVAMGAAFEYVSAWREGREFSYSAKDALADAVSGAAGVGIAQKAARLGKLAKPLFETVANASANTLSAVIRSDCPKGRMAAGDIAGVFGSQLVSQIAMRTQGAVVKKGFGFVKKSADKYAWTNHGSKHVAPANVDWKSVMKSTKNGPAKYIPGTKIEKIEREVWSKGIPTNNAKPWKVQEFERVIGASGGKESSWIRTEMSADTIHGHPITKEEFIRLTR